MLFRSCAIFSSATFGEFELVFAIGSYKQKNKQTNKQTNKQMKNKQTNKQQLFTEVEMNSTWLVTSELANQRARKVLFTCVVYTKHW